MTSRELGKLPNYALDVVNERAITADQVGVGVHQAGVAIVKPSGRPEIEEKRPAPDKWLVIVPELRRYEASELR
jgi:hypothetical protein